MLAIGCLREKRKKEIWVSLCHVWAREAATDMSFFGVFSMLHDGSGQYTAENKDAETHIHGRSMSIGSWIDVYIGPKAASFKCCIKEDV